MKQSYNDSGLTAKRSYRLLAAGLTALAVMCGCSSTQQIPLDDAYYRPGKTVPPREPSSTSSTSLTSSPTPAIEYVSVQDTTITVRIKR